jgi:phosphatidate cytidylyltransferase
MLSQRIATALVLLAILLPAMLWFPPMVWGLVSLAFLTIGASEWVALLGRPQISWRVAGLVALIGLSILVLREERSWPDGIMIVVAGGLTLFWFVAGAWRLSHRQARGGGWPLAVALLLGCWIAMYELRVLGVIALLSSMAVVWLADIAAYFVGRAIGRRRLAPSISPGKTVEGALGGIFAAAAVGVFIASRPDLAVGSLPAMLGSRLAPAVTAIVLVALVALSIVGDLHESLLKRQAKVKDSGKLLPGHGGVLDRIDALIPVMPAALLLYLALH